DVQKVPQCNGQMMTSWQSVTPRARIMWQYCEAVALYILPRHNVETSGFNPPRTRPENPTRDPNDPTTAIRCTGNRQRCSRADTGTASGGKFAHSGDQQGPVIRGLDLLGTGRGGRGAG